MEGIYSKLQNILMAHFESAAGNPSHNGRVCSTWGNFHFKNFDGDIFYFPGVCNYIFASNCKSPYEDFNIQIRRTMVENATVITHVIMRLEGAVVELTRTSVLVNGKQYVHIFYYELKLLGLLSFPEWASIPFLHLIWYSSQSAEGFWSSLRHQQKLECLTVSYMQLLQIILVCILFRGAISQLQPHCNNCLYTVDRISLVQPKY